MTLYHYTCDHGRDALGKVGVVLPLIDHAPKAAARLTVLPDLALISWFTDLDEPLKGPLGLTSRLSPCDRTRWRYRVTDERSVTAWIRSPYRQRLRDLERAADALPMHWFVSDAPVPVVLDLDVLAEVQA